MATHFFPENPTTSGGTDPGFITLTGDISGSGSGTISAFLPAITTGKTSTKITFNSKGQVTGGTSLTDVDLPAHSHSVTILGDVTGIGTNSSISTSLTPVTTAGSGIKINYDDKGRVLSSEGLTTIDLPIHTHSVTISGDVTGTGTNSSINTSLPIITSPGQATKVSYTAKGLVYAGTSLSDTDLPAHDHPVTMTGDVTGTGTNSSISTSLASITTGKTSTKVTFNNKGLVLSGTTLSDTDLPAHTHTVTLTGDVTGTGSSSSIATTLPIITSANTATKITYTAKGLVTGGTTLSDTDLPAHYHTVTVTGDITGTGLNSDLTLTLPNIATAGTYPKVSVNAKGQVTSGSALLAGDIPSLDWAKITTGKPTTLSGYGITNAYTKSDIDASLAGKQNISNELTALSTLADTPGFIKKTGDGTYTIDANSYLISNQNITLSGDVTGSGTTAINVTLPNIVTAGSSAKPSYNAKGLITGSGSLLASDIPTLDSTKVTGVVDIASAQAVTGQKTLTGGVIINDTIVESSISATELFTSWQSATGWTISGAEASHTIGVDSITGNLASSLVLNEVYRIALNITNRTVGSITLAFAGNSIPLITTTSTLDLPVSTTGNTFSFLPTTDFNGTVSLSVRLINPSSSLVSGINGIKGRFGSTFLGLGTGLYRIQSLSNGCSFMGVNAGSANTTGYDNSFMGLNAGRFNTTGYNNSFMGVNAGYANTTGSSNSFMGVNAGYANTTGYNNSFMGVNVGYANTTGYNNSFMGLRAGYANTTGYNNSFMGVFAGRFNTTGNANIFLGFEAGFSSTNESNCLYIANNRDFDFLKGNNINLASTAVLRVNGTVASTSTTTGAIVTPGGVGVGGALFAQSLNGQLVLNRFTTATRPVASASTLGQVWLNTDTGKIEYVATASTIQVITSA